MRVHIRKIKSYDLAPPLSHPLNDHKSGSCTPFWSERIWPLNLVPLHQLGSSTWNCSFIYSSEETHQLAPWQNWTPRGSKRDWQIGNGGGLCCCICDGQRVDVVVSDFDAAADATLLGAVLSPSVTPPAPLHHHLRWFQHPQIKACKITTLFNLKLTN